MAWDEAEIHAWLARRARPRILAGSQGHDAAVLRAFPGLPVACADQVIEGVHVERGCPGRALGRKAAGRALSDLAATAARPRALLVCVAAPPAEDARRIRAAIEGVHAKAREHGAELVGGDLATTSGPLTLAVTALGTFETPSGVRSPQRRPPGRDRARPGELVLVSGPLGGSRLGRHLDPRPRFDAAEFLLACGARVLMDVSDGLALDLARIAELSGVRIDLERVPVHADARRLARSTKRDARSHALGDGEDHELLATLAPRAWAAAEAEAARRLPGLQVIGRVRPRTGREAGLWVAEEDGGKLAPWRWARGGGWIHGR